MDLVFSLRKSGIILGKLSLSLYLLFVIVMLWGRVRKCYGIMGRFCLMLWKTYNVLSEMLLVDLSDCLSQVSIKSVGLGQ